MRFLVDWLRYGALATAIIVLPASVFAQSTNDWVRTVVAQRAAAVVRIATEVSHSDGTATRTFPGTGFFVSSRGLLLTAAHVVPPQGPGQSRRILVFPRRGSTDSIQAREVARVDNTDAVLLQIAGDAVWPTIPFGRSAEVDENELVVFAGFPAGQWSSGSGRLTNTRDQAMWVAGFATQGGASGSPVLDRCGRAIGMIVETRQDRRLQTDVMPEANFYSSLVERRLARRDMQLDGCEWERGAAQQSNGDRWVLARPSNAPATPPAGTVQPLSRPDGRAPQNSVWSRVRIPALNAEQVRELQMLFDMAAQQTLYHSGRFPQNITQAVPNSYLQNGQFFHPEQSQRQRSTLPNTDRAAVADAYLNGARLVLARNDPRANFRATAAALAEAGRDLSQMFPN